MTTNMTIGNAKTAAVNAANNEVPKSKASSKPKKPAKKYAVQKGTIAKLNHAANVVTEGEKRAHAMTEQERAALANARTRVDKARAISRFPLNWYAYKWVLDTANQYSGVSFATVQ